MKNATGVDTSNFAKKTNLSNLKSGVDKLDIHNSDNIPNKLSNLKIRVYELDVDKIVPVPVGLSKLSDVVKNFVFKKMYLMLGSKILKIQYVTLLT